MNRFELVYNIINFFKKNKNTVNTVFDSKCPLVLFSNENTELRIEKFYQYDVTICEYNNSKIVKIYQEEYADLSIAVLELIYNNILEFQLSIN